MTPSSGICSTVIAVWLLQCGRVGEIYRKGDVEGDGMGYGEGDRMVAGEGDGDIRGD